MEKVRLRLDQFLRRTPRLGQGVFIARNATVIGDVTLGDRASVWFGAVLRGDINRIEIGACSNIQDNAVVISPTTSPRSWGHVTVGTPPSSTPVRSGTNAHRHGRDRARRRQIAAVPRRRARW
jgi:serine acetyltransferase